jgi:hypothetical protein
MSEKAARASELDGDEQRASSSRFPQARYGREVEEWQHVHLHSLFKSQNISSRFCVGIKSQLMLLPLAFPSPLLTSHFDRSRLELRELGNDSSPSFFFSLLLKLFLSLINEQRREGGEDEGGKEIFLRRAMCYGNYFDFGARSFPHFASEI